MLNTKDKHGSSSLQLLDDDGSALSLVILCPPWQWSSSCGDLYCMATLLHSVASSFISLGGSRVGICVSGAVSLHWVTTRLVLCCYDTVIMCVYYHLIVLSSEIYVWRCDRLTAVFILGPPSVCYANRKQWSVVIFKVAKWYNWSKSGLLIIHNVIHTKQLK
jgi:hypothetical protein